MGRFGPEKQLSVLIGAFAKVAVRHSDWSLILVGNGDLRDALTEQVRQLGLTDRVLMPGVAKHPEAIMKACHLYAMTSEFEGFPNALGEAMACGLPAVSFDCRFGPKTIIRHGVDGLLVPANDANAFVGALDTLMTDDALRGRMAEKALEVTGRFDLKRIMDQWEALIRRIAGKTGKDN